MSSPGAVYSLGVRAVEIGAAFLRTPGRDSYDYVVSDHTMPAHTHDRRTECYLYFDLPEDARIVHIMGEPSETRHLVVANDEAIISPSWSVHSGFGTRAYSFVWAMAGENKSFDDMDTFEIGMMR